MSDPLWTVQWEVLLTLPSFVARLAMLKRVPVPANCQVRWGQPGSRKLRKGSPKRTMTVKRPCMVTER